MESSPKKRTEFNSKTLHAADSARRKLVKVAGLLLVISGCRWQKEETERSNGCGCCPLPGSRASKGSRKASIEKEREEKSLHSKHLSAMLSGGRKPDEIWQEKAIFRPSDIHLRCWHQLARLHQDCIGRSYFIAIYVISGRLMSSHWENTACYHRVAQINDGQSNERAKTFPHSLESAESWAPAE